MRNDYFAFGGVSSRDYGVILTGAKTEDTPEREVESVEIPGRSGNLQIDKKRWKNVHVSYGAVIRADFMSGFDDLKAALLSLTGYQRLVDSFRENEYRMASLKNSISPETTSFNKAGQFEIVFDCKPQRFLKSGEAPVTFTSGAGTIENPTRFEALPKITVYGSDAGTVTIGGTVVEVKSITDQITIDCETMQAYRQVGDGVPENYNGNIYAPEFPVLRPGENAVGFAGGITKVELIPRWWTI